MILVDTNVLVYSVNSDAPRHQPSRALVQAVRQKQLEAVVVPQILIEFFAVVTDRRRIERPLGPATAWQEVETFKAIFRVLDPGLTALDRLATLLGEVEIAGADVFDAWLAAQALACGISAICTYNPADLSKFAGITVLTAEEALGGTFQ